MTDSSSLSIQVGQWAYEALVKEALLTPKPGLVDQNNSGAHLDMDLELFLLSASILHPFFVELAQYGVMNRHLNPKSLFLGLRLIGIEAEESMLKATKGTNTHKGAFFGLGLLVGAAGYLGEKANVNSLCALCGTMTEGLSLKEPSANLARWAGFKKEAFYSFKEEILGRDWASEEPFLTYLSPREKQNLQRELKRYEKLRYDYGIRAEAENCFLHSRALALPLYKNLSQSHDDTTASLIVLLSLMAFLPDTNILKRGGTTALKTVQEESRRLLPMFSLAKLMVLDQKLKLLNLSPGGSADCLIFMYFLSRFP